jgi:hypothetical protein
MGLTSLIPFSAFSRRVFDTALMAAVSLAAMYPAAQAALHPSHPEAGVAVIYAPWTGFDDAFRQSVEAGARFVRAGGLPFIVVVVPEDADFERRVRARGAWMLADPVALAGCFNVLGLEARS